MHAGSLQSHPALCNPVVCGLPGFSVQVVLQARIMEHFGQYWLSYPSRATKFPATLAANSPKYLVLPYPLRPKQLHHFHIWSSLGKTQVLQGSLRSKTLWTTHMQR